MARTVVDVLGAPVTVAFDEPGLVAMASVGIARLEPRDEMTRRPPAAPLAVRSANPKLRARISDGGLVAAVGRPWDLVSPLLQDFISVELDVTAPRYHLRRYRGHVPLRRLVLAAPAATDSLSFTTSATGLAVGQRLLIGANGAGEAVELARIRSLGPGPTQVQLEGNVRGPHSAGALVVPDEFVMNPASAVDLEMHRQPVLLRGRVVRRAGSALQGVPNADISITQIWRSAPLAATTIAPEAPVSGQAAPAPPWAAPIAALRAPLYRDVPALTATLQVEDRPFDTTVATQTLIERASAGANAVRVSARVGFAAGDVIAIDADDADREELIAITEVAGALSANLPATFALAEPLRFAHAVGAVVRRLGAPSVAPAPAANPPPLGAPRILNRGGLENDPVLLADMRALTGEHQVQIFDPGPPIVRSYHRLRPIVTRSDAEGFFRLPPLARAGRVTVAATSGPLASGDVVIDPDYSADEHSFDLIVS